MRKALLFCFLILASLTIGAQKNGTAAKTKVSKSRPLTGLNKNSGVLRDTIFPEVFGQQCANQVTSFTLTDVEGFLFGSNGYFDVEKAQRITFGTETGFYVEEIGVAFADYDASIANEQVFISLYNDLDPNGTSFGEYLGDSDTINISEVLVDPNDILYTRFRFAEPLLVDGPGFLASVNLSLAYNNDDPGYLGILSTDQDCGDGENAFELFQTDDGLAWSSIAANYNGLDAEMLLYAIVDTELTSATREPLTNYGLSVYPNPTTSRVEFTYELPLASGDYELTLHNLTGREVGRAAATGRSLQMDVSALPAGVYLYRMRGQGGQQTGRLVIE